MTLGGWSRRAAARATITRARAVDIAIGIPEHDGDGGRGRDLQSRAAVDVCVDYHAHRRKLPPTAASINRNDARGAVTVTREGPAKGDSPIIAKCNAWLPPRVSKLAARSHGESPHDTGLVSKLRRDAHLARPSRPGATSPTEASVSAGSKRSTRRRGRTAEPRPAPLPGDGRACAGAANRRRTDPDDWRRDRVRACALSFAPPSTDCIDGGKTRLSICSEANRGQLIARASLSLLLHAIAVWRPTGGCWLLRHCRSCTALPVSFS